MPHNRSHWWKVTLSLFDLSRCLLLFLLFEAPGEDRPPAAAKYDALNQWSHSGVRAVPTPPCSVGPGLCWAIFLAHPKVFLRCLDWDSFFSCKQSKPFALRESPGKGLWKKYEVKFHFAEGSTDKEKRRDWDHSAALCQSWHQSTAVLDSGIALGSLCSNSNWVLF